MKQMRTSAAAENMPKKSLAAAVFDSSVVNLFLLSMFLSLLLLLLLWGFLLSLLFFLIHYTIFHFFLLLKNYFVCRLVTRTNKLDDVFGFNIFFSSCIHLYVCCFLYCWLTSASSTGSKQKSDSMPTTTTNRPTRL